MPRTSLIKNYLGFTKGKITEANNLTFPENSLRSAMNVDLGYEGTVKRRLGVDFEEEYQLGIGMTSAESEAAFQVYFWEGSAIDNSGDIVVVRNSEWLYFYAVDSDTVSAHICHSYSLGAGTGTAEISFASSKGTLYVACAGTKPFYFTRTGESSFDSGNIDIKIRDTLAPTSPDGLGERPASLSNSHTYHLINQGWPERQVSTSGGRKYAWDAFRTAHYNKRGVYKYPSLGDLYTGAGTDTYNASLDVNTPENTTVAPRGHFVLNLFDQIRAFDLTGSSPVTVSRTLINERPSVIGTYKGHVIYGGINNKDTKDSLYMSKSLTSPSVAGDCFSHNDPTSDIESSPLDTDGGVITIDGLGKCLSITSWGESAVVISDSGVWTIKAADGGTFSINNMAINKISSSGAIGKDTVAVYDNFVFYWGHDGIYQISKDQSGINDIATNISEFTIQSDYLAIPSIARKHARVISDPINRKIYWLYDNSLVSSQAATYKTTDMLILDVRLGAFYDYSISTPEAGYPVVSGGFVIKGAVLSENTEPVTSGGEVVQSGSAIVTTTDYSFLDPSDTLKLLIVDRNNLSRLSATFGGFTNRSFVDWESLDSVGVLYSSYIETGYDLVGSVKSIKSAPYIYCFFNRTETSFVSDGAGGVVFDYPSSCYMRPKWDWTSTGTANRWGPQEQVYRFKVPYIAGNPSDPFDYSFDVIETKSKLRGHGKSLSIRFESEGRKDFQLLGWAIEYTAEVTQSV